MKISYQWLKDYVPIGIPPEKLAYKLTMAGLEVEKSEKAGRDTVMELEITPNRPDCLSMLGIAREISAILNKPMKAPKVLTSPKRAYPKTKADVTIDDPEGCRRYVGVLIEDVKVGASPQWLKDRLTALGIRPVNNIVDITNFCLMETGQPLHAFDHDKLKEGKIIVRRARKGEEIITIDGDQHKLDPSVLVIADAKRPVAIAGIMGGLETEVTEKTRNIFLESAWFDSVMIRRAVRSLGLASDSSYRFERGVDVPTVSAGADRAVELITQIAQGRPSRYRDAFEGRKKKTKAAIKVSIDTVNQRLGARITAGRCRTILKKLGLDVYADGKKGIKAVPPSFRSDLCREVDIIEEIARIIGYDDLPMDLPLINIENVAPDPARQIKQGIRHLLNGQGLDEVVTYSMTNRADLDKCRLHGIKAVAIQNPLSMDQELMRPSSLPNLLQAAALNIHRGQKDLKFFELGKIYPSRGEKDVLSLIMTGRRLQDWRRSAADEVDVYDIKGALEDLASRMRIRDLTFEENDDRMFAPGFGCDVRIGGRPAGVLGKLHRDALKNWDIKSEEIYFAQVDLAGLVKNARTSMSYSVPSEYPPVTRDVSIAVDKDVAYVQVESIVRREAAKLLAGLQFKEQYLGEKISPDQRGLVFSVVYQSPNRTLTDEEVNAVHEKVLRSLTDELPVSLR